MEIMSDVSLALQNLQLPAYNSIRVVFGKALERRSRQKEPNCTIFNWLALKAHPLELLNEDCAIYIDAIGVEDAQRKCNSDVLGKTSRPFVEFNGSCGDFWAEMAAIKILKRNGYSRFRPIHKQLSDGTTSDYEAHRGSETVLIEVKNVRPNSTMLDVFNKEIQQLYNRNPCQFGFSIAFEYPYDRRPTAEQEHRIVQFLESLCGVKPPVIKELDLVDAVSKVTVREGFGTAVMTRAIRPSSPEPLSMEWFSSKIRSKAEEAYSQMKNSSGHKVLVINFDSPSGLLSTDFVDEARKVMVEVFNGEVDPYFLVYRDMVPL